MGAAGQMLNRIIGGCGLKREEIFICNILRCRPPGNRQPKPQEAANCREYLDGTIDLVSPKVICVRGAVAAQNLLGTTTGITKLRGRFYEYRNIPVLCTFIPPHCWKGGVRRKRKTCPEDMKFLLAKIGKPIPTVKKG